MCPLWALRPPILLRNYMSYFLIFIIFSNCATKEESCSGSSYINVTLTKQYLTTPYYGIRNYPPHMNCSYILKAPVYHRIILELVFLDMEKQLFISCLDHVGLYDGYQERLTSPYLTFCGHLRNRQITSRSDTITIEFRADDLIEGKGANISYQAVPFGICDPGWIEGQDRNCYRYVDIKPRSDWVEAQNQCSEQQSNLANIRTKDEYEFFKTKFSHISTHPWIGYTDANEEGILKGINDKLNTIWPPSLSFLSRKSDVQDCLYLDYTHINQNPYHLEDCRIKQTFICQKQSNWSTVVIGSQKERIRSGSKPASVDFTFWLLILVAFILLLILLCIICQACAKKREQNRVHSSEGNRLVRGIDGAHSDTNVLPTSLDTNIQRRAEVIHHSETSDKMLSEHTPVHSTIQITAPKEVKLPKLVEESETRLAELARPREKTEKPVGENTEINIDTSPMPRTVPPLPIRESTFLTLHSREESFMRTKRTAELFERPKMTVLDNVSAISLDEFWSNAKKQ